MGLSGSASDELVAAALLSPLAGTKLRAPIRCGMSISDASEEGAGSAIADSFVPQLTSVREAFDDLALESAMLGSVDPGVVHLAVCPVCDDALTV